MDMQISRQALAERRKRSGITIAVVEVSAANAFKLQQRKLLPPDFFALKALERKPLLSRAIVKVLQGLSDE